MTRALASPSSHAAPNLPAARLRPSPPGVRLSCAALAVRLGCATLTSAALTPLLGAAHAQAAATVQSQVPAGPLAEALSRFALQAGVAIVVDADRLAGRATPGLTGAVTVAEGFRRLLEGSGYQARATAAGYVLVQAPPAPAAAVPPPPVKPDSAVALPGLKVSATVEHDITRNLGSAVQAGALGALAQKDAPFSTAVVTSQQIQEQAPQKLGDLFVQDASVSDNSGAYTAWSTYLTVRGMELDWQNSYRIDGKPYLGYTVTLPYEHMEQVELLKGATGFLYGFGAPGGMLNYVTKKPTATRLRSVSLGLASDRIVRFNADLGGRLRDTLGSDGLGYRLDATHESGRTANDGSIQRSSALLALDARLGDRLSWDLQAFYQDRLTEDTEPGMSTRAMGNRLPAPIRNDRTLVGPGNYVDNQFGFLATGLTYRLNDDWQVQTHFSQSYSKTRRNESILYLQNAAGDYVDARADYGERYQYSYGDAMLQGRLSTAGMTHHLVAGLSWQQQRNDDSRNAVWIPQQGTGRFGVQNTTRYDSIGAFDSLGLYRLTEVTHKALFASDRVELNDRWSVLGGLRWIQYEKLNWNGAGQATAPYRENGIVTPTLALMFKLAPGTLAYASYVESLQQGATVPSLPVYTNASQMLNPLMSRQWELGIKKDGSDWAATAALFRVAKTTEYDRSCGTDCLTKVQEGRSTFQGLELGATARLDSAWSLGANLMLLDAEYASSGEAAIDGQRVAGSPRRVATAQLAWRVAAVEGLQLRLGAKHTGRTPLRADNSVNLAGYTVASLGASYDTRLSGQPLTLRANINNLFDHEYWIFQYANYIKAGDARSFSLGATLNF